MPPLINPNEILFNPESGYEQAPKGILDAMWQGTKQTVANIGDASGDFRNHPFSEAAMNAVIMNRPDFIDPSWRQTPDLLKRRVDSTDPSTWAQGNFPVIGGQATMPTNFPMEDTIDPEERATWLAGSTGRDLGQSAPVVQQAVTGVQSKTPPVVPGVIVPDPGMDPVGNLAAKNANIAAGAGNVHGQIKPAPDSSLADVRAAIFKDLGQQVSFDNEELEPWYESPTFYRGLISFGLNLLSGNDLGASFNQAGQYYDQERGREKRGQWRDDLIEAGYNPTEIEAYIDTGDNKLLTDPMERQKQLMDMEAGQLGLDKARWEASHRDEDRQREIDKEKREEERQVRKDALSEQLTRSSIAENEAQRKKALGLVTGGELGSGDLSQPIDKWTKDKYTLTNLWSQFRMNQGYNNQFYGGRSVDDGAAGDVVDQAFRNAGIDKATLNDKDFKIADAIAMMNPEDQAKISSQMAVVLPLLRLESGAAISASEYRTRLNTLFGMRNESPEAVKQKQINRTIVGELINPQLSQEARNTLNARGLIEDIEYTPEGGLMVILKDGTAKHLTL